MFLIFYYFLLLYHSKQFIKSKIIANFTLGLEY